MHLPSAGTCMISLLSSPCPTGITVSLSFYGLHHNPKVWPNPEVWWLWEGGWADLPRPTPSSVPTSGSPVPSLIGRKALTLPVLTLMLFLQVFDPSRFALGTTSHSHAFLPFSGGSRWDVLYRGAGVSGRLPWCLSPPTFVCGACSYTLVCWCVGKESFVYIYKRNVSFQGMTLALLPTDFPSGQPNSASVAVPKLIYSGAFLTLEVWHGRIRISHMN